MNRLLLLLCLAGSSLGAQSAARDTADKTFFTRRDALVAGATLAGSAIVSAFDVRIAHWVQSTVVGDSSHYGTVENLTVVNETPLTIGAFAVYGIGRLAGNETMADVGLHTTEALVLTVGIAEVIRAPLGRSRPRESPDDQYQFRFGKGFTDFAARSYPSIHAAVAWATATALVGETEVRKPEAVKFVRPVLYTAALIPGLTRMYLNQHWTSDVVAGSVMGALLGSKVVHYAHSHRRSKLDELLLGAIVVPDGRGNVAVGASFTR
jgi:membrane-associated phospholipid phosphatase